MTPEAVTLSWARFVDLDATAAYAVWQLRQDVFVVEQECAYPDLDGRDAEPGTRHLLAREGAALVGYLRVLDDGDYDRIGRVVVRADSRGGGLAARLVDEAVAAIGERTIRLDAQAHLAEWYGRRGFVVEGDEFVEDGIPHVPMVRAGR